MIVKLSVFIVKSTVIFEKVQHNVLYFHMIIFFSDYRFFFFQIYDQIKKLNFVISNMIGYSKHRKNIKDKINKKTEKLIKKIEKLFDFHVILYYLRPPRSSELPPH